MISIPQSAGVPLESTDSPIVPKRKYSEVMQGGARAKTGTDHVAISALIPLQVETASEPRQYSKKIKSLLNLPHKLQLPGFKPETDDCTPPPVDLDDAVSDDGFSEFDESDYESCMEKKPQPSSIECVTAAGADKTSSVTSVSFPSLRSGSISSVGSEKKAGLVLSVEKIVKEPPAKEAMAFDEFCMVSGSFSGNQLALVSQAFALGRVIPSSAGKNGSFRILDESGQCIAIFKPREGELGFSSSGAKETKYLRSKEGIEPGEGALSEYVSFRINQALDLIDIPATCYVKVSSKDSSLKKEGSLHEFIPSARTYTDLEPSDKLLLSKDQVEALAIFDLLMFNADRNEENLLVINKPESGLELIGIDHGSILPRSALSGGVFCWRELQQVNWLMSNKAKDIIKSLSSAPLRALREQLEVEGFQDVVLKNFSERLLTHEASIHMLKQGVLLELSLAEIAIFFQDCPPAINPLHKIITSSQKTGKSERDVIIAIQAQVENLLNVYLEVKGICNSDTSIDRKELNSVAAERAIIRLGLRAYS